MVAERAAGAHACQLCCVVVCWVMRSNTQGNGWQCLGVVLLSLALGGGACEPKTAAANYTVNTETVTDATTGLTWERTVNSGSVVLSKAHEYCAGLTLDGWSGFRVPRVMELRSIVRRVRVFEALKNKPAIDGIAFPNTAPAVHWALPEEDNPNKVKAYVVDFSDGTFNNLVTEFESHVVRCVRN